jgi:uncharacterized phage protein (TIGR01671 family)
MREIKFRAWDNGHMIYKTESEEVGLIDMFTGDAVWVELGTESDNDASYKFRKRKFVLMQFTGLKDKNHDDIYEGDIVRHSFGDKFHFGKVVIEPTRGVVIGGHPIAFDVEVIGNIYENPERLKE